MNLWVREALRGVPSAYVRSQSRRETSETAGSRAAEPFRSKAQQRWAFASGQPFAQKWGKLTKKAGGFKGLPQRVAGKP